METLTLLAVLIVLLFDYTIGFHDAANIIATVLASRAMQPMQAMVLVGFFEFLGPLLGGFIPIFAVPYWVMLACASALSLGILSCGWRTAPIPCMTSW